MAALKIPERVFFLAKTLCNLICTVVVVRILQGLGGAHGAGGNPAQLLVHLKRAVLRVVPFAMALAAHIGIVFHYFIGLIPVYAGEAFHVGVRKDAVYVVAALLGDALYSGDEAVAHETVVLKAVHHAKDIAPDSIRIQKEKERIGGAEGVPVGVVVVPERLVRRPFAVVQAAVPGHGKNAVEGGVEYGFLGF